MLNGISIRPSKDLRTNYAQIPELAKKNVAITVNGSEDIVVLSYEDFLEQQRLIADEGADRTLCPLCADAGRYKSRQSIACGRGARRVN